MKQPAIRFTWSDSWLLYSIGLAAHGGKGALKDVIMVGDAVNRAVFTPQELRRGIAKLTAAGLAGERDGLFWLTEQGGELMRQAQAGTSLWDGVKRLDQLIGSVPFQEWDQPNFEDPQWPYPGITDDAVEVARSQYSAEAEAVLDEFIRKPGA